MLKKIIRPFRNFYVLTLSVFAVWMIFFDSNDLISQYQMRSKLKEMEAEKVYYIEKIEEVKEEQQALLSNVDKLERFARENYLMRKQNEDVYITVKE
jgi:cell division protein DivIC